jgi:glycolate oxidase FAD binding subunit
MVKGATAIAARRKSRLMLLATEMRPAFEKDAAQMLIEASQAGAGVEILGSGSKRTIGRPLDTQHRLTTRAMKGITLHEPSEMVLSARAGTPIAEILGLVAKAGQMLAFEPSEYAGLIGTDAVGATIGGVFAMNASGPRRVFAGAARDHLIGVRAVSGSGELFKSGGRVMKNVTGVDLVKGLSGSWGTLALLTEVTFKTVPLPAATTTLVLLGLPDEIAIEALCAAMGTPFEVSGAVHLQQPLALTLDHSAVRSQGKAVTAIRLENTPASLVYRRDALAKLLAPYGKLHDLDNDLSLTFWDELRRLAFFSQTNAQIWRISTAPTKGPKVIESLQRYMAVRAFYDWSGGLVWAEVAPSADAGAADVRRVVATHGGHATLMRAEEAVRAAVDVFQPQDPGLAKLSRRIKTALDPAGILNPGRMTTAF